MTQAVNPSIEFGREICGNVDSAFQREWLVTNGLGGFAGGTVGDALTRRYHGLLMAAIAPPLGRTLLLAKIETTVTVDGRTWELGANRWADGTIGPQGYREMELFRLDGSIPTWSYVFADVELERTIWMESGQNTTYVRYAVHRAPQPVKLELRFLVNSRDYNSLTRAYDVHDVAALNGRTARVQLNPQAPALFLACDQGAFKAGTGWYYGFRLDAEIARGLDNLEDHYNAVNLAVTIAPGQTLNLVASTEPHSGDDAPAAFERRATKDRALIETWQEARGTSATPAWIQGLVLAADQFVVARGSGANRGRTVIAGYPWFGDWGRDTMIALPGLALSTGRPEVAREILVTFAKFLDQGMLPNRFPDAGSPPEYNTVDATLWYVEAIARYLAATHDAALAPTLFAAIESIVDWHVRGTRYSIHVDPADGLLYAGQQGVQLTWMDAKVGNDVITPRTGKPVEINALWHNALTVAKGLARTLGHDAASYASMADKASQSFRKFWNDATGYCFDVIGGPGGDDPSIRPNAVIAASLRDTPLDLAQRRAILEVAARELLTTAGLRSLSPSDPQYEGHYSGSQSKRDRAYHQGTVWPWLLGPFATAHFGVHRDRERALEFIAGIEHFMTAYGVGSVAEIAEGDSPYEPRGCTAQAWSVAEVLRAWDEILHSSPAEATAALAK